MPSTKYCSVNISFVYKINLLYGCVHHEVCLCSTYSGWFRDAQSLKAWAFEFLPSKVTLVKWATFQQTVLQSTEPWIIDFYAPWCGHCQVFAPEFERIAQVSCLLNALVFRLFRRSTIVFIIEQDGFV